jgi:hypothetical protein
LAHWRGGDRQDHQLLAVLRGEIAAEGAEQLVAHPRPLAGPRLRLGLNPRLAMVDAPTSESETRISRPPAPRVRASSAATRLNAQ